MYLNNNHQRSPLSQQENTFDDLSFDQNTTNNSNGIHSQEEWKGMDNNATNTANMRSQSPQSAKSNELTTVTLEDLEFGSNKIPNSDMFKSVGTNNSQYRTNRSTLTTVHNQYPNYNESKMPSSSSFENTPPFSQNSQNNWNDNGRFHNTSNRHTNSNSARGPNTNGGSAHPFAQYFSSFFPVPNQRRHRNTFVESLNEHTQHNNDPVSQTSSGHATATNIMNTLSRNYYFRSPFAYDYRPGESLIFSVDVDDNNNNNNNDATNDNNDVVYRGGMNIRTILSAFLLFFGGLTMVVTGATLYWQSGFKDGMSIFIVGLIMVLPGSYGMTLVTGYCLRWPGYEADRLPLL